MGSSRRRRYSPEQIIRKLREADRLLGEGHEVAAVAKQLEVSEQTLQRWRAKYGGLKARTICPSTSWGSAWIAREPVYEQALPNGGHYAYWPITLLAFGLLSRLSIGAAHAAMIVASVSRLLPWYG
jgi:putative transposase